MSSCDVVCSRYNGCDIVNYEKIYFDMDGVLSDFNKGIVELCKMEAPTQNPNTPEYDERMFSAMRKVDRFYFRLDPIENTLGLFKEVQDICGDKVEILTAIPKAIRNIIGADTDKLEWVRKYLGYEVKVNIVLRRDKPKFAKGSNYLLIDDTPNNIESWRKAGGDDLLFKDAESARIELKLRGILN